MREILSLCLIISFALLAEETNNSTPVASEEIITAKIFEQFTGQIQGNKVRLRLRPDLESPIIKQFKKNDLILIVGEEGDFYKAQAPSDMKFYVFRSYIIDGIVEADRVNIRLQPNLDSPIIGRLKNKEKVEGEVCSVDSKWLEIFAPGHISFFIAKEYVAKVGDPTYLSYMQRRAQEVDKMLNSAFFITTAECKKQFNEMAPEEAVKLFDNIIKSYPDFPGQIQQAKEGLALLQDNYLQKKISFLEAKQEQSSNEKDPLITSIENAIGPESQSKEEMAKLKANALKKTAAVTDKMRFWGKFEENLYLTWTTFHPEKTLDDFYNEQRASATIVVGIVEPYVLSVKNTPGDYIIKTDQTKQAYLYSTKINLDEYIGKSVTLICAPRPNNNFAFPAYFVIDIE